MRKRDDGTIRTIERCGPELIYRALSWTQLRSATAGMEEALSALTGTCPKALQMCHVDLELDSSRPVANFGLSLTLCLNL